MVWEVPLHRSRLALRAFSILLILLGIVLLVTAAGIYAYSNYEQAVVLSQLRATVGIDPSSTVENPPELPLSPEGSASPDESLLSTQTDGIATFEPELNSNTALAEVSPTPYLAPSATPTPQPVPPRRIRIPKIGVDSAVVEATIQNGEWQVPKFVAGHLEGTANLGTGQGNVVLTGHVQSIASGNVFARIGELRAGDDVFLYGNSTVFPYRVTRSFTVKNKDLSVVEPTESPTLTLITCTGTWDPLARDYTERLVVVAESVDVRNLD